MVTDTNGYFYIFNNFTAEDFDQNFLIKFMAHKPVPKEKITNMKMFAKLCNFLLL